MKALIHMETVVEVSEEEFPVNSELRWVECQKEVKVGYLFRNGDFVAPENNQTPTINPTLAEIATLEAEITSRRIREAILGIDNGWLSDKEQEIKDLRKKL